MGRIAAPYAVRGWIKVHTYTEYLDSLLDYPVWQLGGDGTWRTYTVEDARIHGSSLIAKLAGVDDRTAAEAIKGLDVAVGRDELPPAGPDEYYWDDLIGLDVVNTHDEPLGQVSGLLESGAHDLLKVSGERERLIPFVAAIVLEVDLVARRVRVDWEKDYG